MCTPAIVDAHLLAKVIPKDPSQETEDKNQFIKWIWRRHGKIVYTEHGVYNKEVLKVGSILPALRRLSEGGLTKLIQKSDLLKAEENLQRYGFYKASNDKHILELSLASDALILCTEDAALKDYFCQLPKVQGNSRAIYPFDAKKGTRQTFLDKRQCPKITKK